MTNRTIMTDKERKDNQPYDIDLIQEPQAVTKTIKTANRIAIISLLIVAFGLALILRWGFQNERVLQVKNSPFPVRTIREHPTAGGVVILTTDYCKHQDITGKLRISFVSSSREVFLPLTTERLPEGCIKREVPILIPKDIAPDVYKIKFRATYDINPLKRGVPVEFESQPVEISPSTPTNDTP